MKLTKALFRLDAASYMGLGHAYQSMALAEEFRIRGIEVFFAMKKYESNIVSWVRSQGIEVFTIPPDFKEEQELDILIPFVLSRSIGCIIIDHHSLGHDYTYKLRSQEIFVTQIDDVGNRKFGCDLLINYNIYAPTLNYDVDPYTKCLFGPKYAILRRQFLAEVKRHNSNKRLLVTMGGGYARGEVIKVLDALKLLNNAGSQKIDSHILIGPGYPSYESLIAQYKDFPAKFHFNLKNIRVVMENTDFAVSGGGGTLYELSRMGLPSIIIELDENQKLNAQYFEKFGISKNLGWHENVKAAEIAKTINDWIDLPQTLKKRQERAINLVDGLGTKRIVDNILSCFY